MKNGDVKSETINSMTPAQARRLYMNTKDATLRARLAGRFPDLAQPGPASAAAAEEEEEKRKQQEKEDEEREKKEAEEAEEAKKKEKKDK